MNKYFIALIPEERLNRLVEEQKKLVRTIVGEQKYLSEPPHLTLIVFTSKKIQEIIKVLKGISKTIKKFSINLSDFKIFYNDIQTKMNTITYSLSKQEEEYLKTIQSKIILGVNKFNTKDFLKKESEIYSKMKKIEKENIKKYGFPFVGKNWIPHITIVSIEPSKFSRVFEKLKENFLSGVFNIDSIGLYKINKKSVLIKKFKLT
jgi:2'-5' RNA ligase